MNTLETLKSGVTVSNPKSLKVNRGTSALCSQVANIYDSELGIKTDRAGLLQVVSQIPYPEELPEGKENILNMAQIVRMYPHVPDSVDKLANYKVSDDWLTSREPFRDWLSGHHWFRRSDKSNVIYCDSHLKTDSALVLGDALSGLRRVLKVTGNSQFSFQRNPSKQFDGVDKALVTLFELYSFDEELLEGLARFYTFSFDFRTGLGSAANCGQCSLSDIINEEDLSMAPDEDLEIERIFERDEEER